ncbi:MAG: Histidine kinase, gyrase and HSP90-like ATPase [Gemmatimonadetes bacterium]|jgi:nitrogen fixation/metabolism regulation signal transduction histidine kinase|nr:Histidine kinase, gyrase and HSP90-like ATPase [Gemmatimonadota bacterium]
MELRRVWTRQPPWFASYGVALAGVALAVLVTRVLHSAPIGLAVSRSIVELHGGRISANPNEGPGVTMRVSLPAGPAST